jgi:hypothetical protein
MKIWAMELKRLVTHRSWIKASCLNTADSVPTATYGYAPMNTARHWRMDQLWFRLLVLSKNNSVKRGTGFIKRETESIIQSFIMIIGNQWEEKGNIDSESYFKHIATGFNKMSMCKRESELSLHASLLQALISYCSFCHHTFSWKTEIGGISMKRWYNNTSMSHNKEKPVIYWFTILPIHRPVDTWTDQLTSESGRIHPSWCTGSVHDPYTPW